MPYCPICKSSNIQRTEADPTKFRCNTCLRLVPEAQLRHAIEETFAQLVKTLREETGKGLITCKQALIAADYSLEDAREILAKAASIEKPKQEKPHA